MKRKLSIIALGCLFLAISYILWTYKFWPFATASNIPAFAGTKFKMSLPEVQRNLRKNNIKLVDYDTFNKINHIHGDKKAFWWEQYIVAEHELFPGSIKYIDQELWYMPAISMFNSQVVAEFNFNNNKLDSVYVIVFPLSDKEAINVVKNITDQLQKKYAYIIREDSKEIPGAYEIIYGNELCRLKLWVNLRDHKDPVITIYIEPSISTNFNERDENRYELAFD